MKSPYFILEIGAYSTDEEIKVAYRKLSLKYHPDKNENGEEKFIEVKNAYEILRDSEKKRLYDKFGYVEGEKENTLDVTLTNLNKEVKNEEIGELRVKNFHQSLKEKIPQTVCLECDGLGHKEQAEGFFIMQRDCNQCFGTGYIDIIIKQKSTGGFFNDLAEFFQPVQPEPKQEPRKEVKYG